MRISVQEAIDNLQKGQVIAIPTETVYGLAASLACPDAIKQIFALKNRPPANPLIIHVSDLSQLIPLAANFPPHFHALAQAFWPGPLTMILPIQPDRVDSHVRAGLETAGFRMPHHPLALKVLEATGPLVMPSANLSGRPSATEPAHVEADFGITFPVLDGGSCSKGLESTILYFRSPEWIILRLGALGPEAFQSVLGYQPLIQTKETLQSQPLCPGQLFRHYAPKAKLLLGDSSRMSQADCILGFSERQYPASQKQWMMGSLACPEEVAKNLYRLLRQLDQEHIQVAWIDMDFPKQGIWLTIAERLQRAGEPR